MIFRELIYEIYKLDWKRGHIIFPQREVDALVDFYEDKNNGNIEADMSLPEYIEEYVYSGELYSSYDKFLENEYLDGSYVDYLIESYIGSDKQSTFREFYESDPVEFEFDEREE